MLLVLAVALAGCTGPPVPVGDNGTPSMPPTGGPLSREDLSRLAAFFDDEPFQGGQVAPRLSKWVSDDTFVFLQFDRFPLANATALRYVGLGQKGVFCSEAQPDAGNGGFSHFHRWSVATYGAGHGGPPAAEGYWLSWLAVDRFASQGRNVAPGIDYGFSPTPPPSCGASVPSAAFEVPGARPLGKDALGVLASWFDDDPFQGGQVAPRLSRWVGNDTFVFVQFDKFPVANATGLRYLGLGVRGTFCEGAQPSADFPHFHRWNVATYGQGHGGPPRSQGYWLLWLAVDGFEAQGRQVMPGVDRQFSPTPPPAC